MFHTFLALVFVRHYHTRGEEHVFTLFVLVFLTFLGSCPGMSSLCFVRKNSQTLQSQSLFHQVWVMSHDGASICY